jgi:hypothetical protein
MNAHWTEDLLMIAPTKALVGGTAHALSKRVNSTKRSPMKKLSKKTPINKLSFPKAPKALKVKTDITAGGEGRDSGALIPCVRPGALIICNRIVQPCIRQG